MSRSIVHCPIEVMIFIYDIKHVAAPFTPTFDATKCLMNLTKALLYHKCLLTADLVFKRYCSRSWSDELICVSFWLLCLESTSSSVRRAFDLGLEGYRFESWIAVLCVTISIYYDPCVVPILRKRHKTEALINHLTVISC